MIRKRKPADNTPASGLRLVNPNWSAIRRSPPCAFCGFKHDGAGRAIDERGKLVEEFQCPEAKKQAAQPRRRGRQMTNGQPGPIYVYDLDRPVKTF